MCNKAANSTRLAAIIAGGTTKGAVAAVSIIVPAGIRSSIGPSAKSMGAKHILKVTSFSLFSTVNITIT